MMEILNEIKKLRGDTTLHIDRTNDNPYRLVLYEGDGTRTAYYFAVPIYNLHTRRLLPSGFASVQDAYTYSGSTAELTVQGDTLHCQGGDVDCQIVFEGGVFREKHGTLQNDSFQLFSTLNGVACRGMRNEEAPAKCILHVENPALPVRSNGRCFSLMSSEFRPFITVSGSAGLGSFGQVAAPLRVHYQRLTDHDYALELFSDSPYSHTAFFEINMYAAKLFQDTTVDSLKADTNNAFGGTAFIGNTAAYGEEWLYTRLDYAHLEGLIGRELRRAAFHIPLWDSQPVQLSAFSVASRFCSFGSTWNNKVAETYKIGDSVVQNGYHHIDLSEHLIEQHTHALQHREGMILRSKVKGSGYTAVSTGDSYYAPQILEINFR